MFLFTHLGSGGQISLNEAIIDVIKKYNGHNNVKILHVTGKKLYDGFMKDLTESIKLERNIEIRITCMKPPGTFCRRHCNRKRRAITIAEITAIRVPSILIQTYTAENHQVYNARALEKEGAALVILEKI